jgi:hypothetical protein
MQTTNITERNMKRILTMALAAFAALAFGAFSSAVSTVVSTRNRKEESVFEANETVTALGLEGETASTTVGDNVFTESISTESTTGSMSLQSKQRRSGAHEVGQINNSLS